MDFMAPISHKIIFVCIYARYLSFGLLIGGGQARGLPPLVGICLLNTDDGRDFFSIMFTIKLLSSVHSLVQSMWQWSMKNEWTMFTSQVLRSSSCLGHNKVSLQQSCLEVSPNLPVKRILWCLKEWWIPEPKPPSLYLRLGTREPDYDCRIRYVRCTNARRIFLLSQTMVDSSSTKSFRVLCTLIFKSTSMLSIPSNSYSQPFAFLSTHKANDSLQPLPVPTESHSRWYPVDVLASALQIRMKVNAIFMYPEERGWKRDIGNFLEKITVILHSTCPRSMVCLIWH